MKVELVGITKGVSKYSKLGSEEIIAAIARHGIIKEDRGKLVKYLMDNNHWSPLDMINIVFEIQTSRAIGRQILRHSSIKFQEHSQRYSDNVNFEYIELRKEHPTNRQSSTEIFNPIIQEDNYWITANEKIQRLLFNIELAYKQLLSLGVAKECARMILPECTSSILSANGTLRSWLSFLNVRCDHHAQKECRDIANLIGLELELHFHNIFSKINWRNGLFM